MQFQNGFAVANYKDQALFISGGMKPRSDRAANSVIKLDLQTKEAMEFQSMNYGRFAHASTVLGSKLYVIWGSGGRAYGMCKNLELIDLEQGDQASWEIVELHDVLARMNSLVCPISDT